MANRLENPSRNQLAADRRKARHYAMQALYQWHMAGQALNEIEAQFQADYDMTHVDKEFFHDLVANIPAQLTALHWSVRKALDRKLTDLDSIEVVLFAHGVLLVLASMDVPISRLNEP